MYIVLTSSREPPPPPPPVWFCGLLPVSDQQSLTFWVLAGGFSVLAIYLGGGGVCGFFFFLGGGGGDRGDLRNFFVLKFVFWQVSFWVAWFE